MSKREKAKRRIPARVSGDSRTAEEEIREAAASFQGPYE